MNDLLLWLAALDQAMFFWINLSWAHPLLDHLMVFITTKQNMYLPGGLLFGWLLWKGGREGRAAALLVIVAIALADQISASFLKPTLERIRPCKTLEGFRLLTHCGGRYAFPSSHASNAAAVGTLMVGLWGRGKAVWIFLVVLIGLSRVYVGVHYPGDVIGGWVLGILIGIALISLYRYADRRWRPRAAGP